MTEQEAMPEQGYDIDKLAAILKNEYRVADSYRDTLWLLEQEAFKYYEGAPFGNEVEGRSQIVLPDVQETVDYMAASVLRTFLSGDRVVEFEATDEADEELADEATAAVNYSFMRKQDGYRVLHDVCVDGLLRKTGIFKTCVETYEKITRETVKGTHEQLLIQHADMPHDVEIEDVSDNGDGTVTAKLKRSSIEKCFCDYAISPANFRFSPRALHEDVADYLCHADPEKTRSDLVEMGFDKDQVYRLPAHARPYKQATESGELDRVIEDESSAALEKVLLCEEYCRIDIDGDGIAERVKVFRVENEILIDAETGEPSIETVEDQPFSVFCPFPRPHRMVGYSLADKVMDIQLGRSFVARQLFDGMALANMPRTVVDSRLADNDTYADILNPIPGSPIRAPGGAATVQALPSGFDPGKSLQVMEWYTGERESRTGITRLNQGLDADALNKMLCVKTPVPLADGSYKQLGEIQDGELIVGSDGRPVKVLKAHKAHFPIRAYDLKFASGEVIRAGGEHLWTVQTDNDKRYGKSQTVDTDKLAEMLRYHSRIYIPRVARPMTGKTTELPLDPYVLGVWLGDGSRHAPRVTTEDPFIVNALKDWCTGRGELREDKHQNSGNAKSYYVGGLYPVLREMKMLLRGDTNKDADIIGKHIPEQYFLASYDQRLALLRGLMDTDGCLHSNALTIFCQKSGRLLEDTIRLIRSLGGWPTVKTLKPQGRFAHKGEHVQVFFTLADNPFAIPRKADRWKRTNRNLTTQVVEAAYPTAPVLMRCLTVEAEDGLFCVGDRFTVTHNTATGTALMQAQGQQQEEFVARNLAEAVSRLFAKKYRLMRTEGEPFRIKVDGQYKMVDPSRWPDDVNMVVRVGLGSNSKEKRIQALMGLVPIMSEGFMQGMVTPQHTFHLIDKLVRDMGVGTGDDFWIDPDTPEGQQAMQQHAQQPDPKSAALQAKAQTDQQKLQLQAQQAQGKQQIDAGKAQMQAQTTAQIAQMKIDAQREAANAKIAADQQRAEMEAQLEMRRQDLEADTHRYVSANRSGGSLDA